VAGYCEQVELFGFSERLDFRWLHVGLLCQ